MVSIVTKLLCKTKTLSPRYRVGSILRLSTVTKKKVELSKNKNKSTKPRYKYFHRASAFNFVKITWNRLFYDRRRNDAAISLNNLIQIEISFVTVIDIAAIEAMFSASVL